MDAFLKESKRKLSTITDETKVHVVIGNEACDLDSAVSALVYAFYLYSLSKNQTDKSDVVYIPVLNIPREDYPLRTEVTHCLRANQIADDTIVFRDDIDLRTLHEKSQLMLTLVDHNVLVKSDTFMDDDIVEIIDHRSNGRHDSEDREIDITLELVGSCSTLVTEKILVDNRDILDETTTTLLLSTILVDTFNLSETAKKKTPKDEAMVAELQQICSHIDRHQLFEGIEKVKFDVSGLSTTDLLRKDYKSILDSNINIGMSSITLHLKDLLRRPSLENDLQRFCADRNLHVLMLINLALVDKEMPQRQLGVYTSGFKSLKDILVRALQETEIPPLQLSEIEDSPSTVAAFDQGNVAASRKKIMPIIQHFLEDLEGDPARVKEVLGCKPESETVDLLGGDLLSGLDPLEASQGNLSPNQNNSCGNDPFGISSLSSSSPTGTSVQNAHSDDPFGLGALDNPFDSTSNNNKAEQDLQSSALLNIDPFNNLDSKTTGPGPPGLLDLDPFGSLEAPVSTSISSSEANLLPDLNSLNSALKPPSLLDLEPFAGMGDSTSGSSNLASPSNPFESTVTSDPFEPMTTSPSSPSSVPLGETEDFLGLDPFAAPPQSPSLTSGGTLSSNNPFQNTNLEGQNANDLLGLGDFSHASVPPGTGENDGNQNANDPFGLGDLLSAAPSEGNLINQNSNDVFDLGISGNLDNMNAESTSNSNVLIGAMDNMAKTNSDDASQNVDNVFNNPLEVHAGQDLIVATMDSPILDIEDKPSSSTSTLDSESNLLSGFSMNPFAVDEGTDSFANNNPFSPSNENARTLNNPFGDSGISSQGGSGDFLGVDAVNSLSITTNGDEVHLQESQQDVLQDEDQTFEKSESQKVQDVKSWTDEIESSSPFAEGASENIFFSNDDINVIPQRPLKNIPKTPSNSVSDITDVFISELDEKTLDSQTLSDKVEELHRSKLMGEADEEADFITVGSHKPTFPREDSLSPLGDERTASPSSETCSDDGSNSSSGESYTVNDYNRGPDQFAITQIQEADEEDDGISDLPKDVTVAEKGEEEEDESKVKEPVKTDEDQKEQEGKDNLTNSGGVTLGVSELDDSTGQEDVEIEGDDIAANKSKLVSEDLAVGVEDYVNNVVQMSSFVYKQEMAEVADTEKTPEKDSDVVISTVESGEPEGKSGEQVCDFVDTVDQMASFAYKQEASKAEMDGVQSKKVQETENVESSISKVSNEPPEEETEVVGPTEERMDKDESMVQDANEAATNVEEKEEQQMESEDVSVAIDKLEERKEKAVEEVADNVDAVVQMSSFAYKQGASEAEDEEKNLNPGENEDVSVATAEPKEKAVEEVADYIDDVVQMASFACKQGASEAEVEEVQSEDIQEKEKVESSISEIADVEPQEVETNQQSSVEEPSDKDEGVVQEAIDADVTVDEDINSKPSENEDVSVTTAEPNEKVVEEIADYIDDVVQMTSFACKQGASEAEVEEVQSEEMQEKGSVESSISEIADVEPQEVETNQQSSVEEPSDKDEGMVQEATDADVTVDEEINSKPSENEDVSVTTAEPNEKVVEEIADYIDDVVQTTLFTCKQGASEAEVEEVQSEDIQEKGKVESSISEIADVEPQEVETNQQSSVEEPSDKDEGMVQEATDADVTVDEEINSKPSENEGISVTTAESEKPNENVVEELTDYVDTVVQMASFAYKQEVSEEVEEVESENVQEEEVESSISEIMSVEPPKEGTNEVSKVDEQLGDDGSINQSINHAETVNANNQRKDVSLDVASGVLEEPDNLVAAIEQSQTTVQEGSCDVIAYKHEVSETVEEVESENVQEEEKEESSTSEIVRVEPPKEGTNEVSKVDEQLGSNGSINQSINHAETVNANNQRKDVLLDVASGVLEEPDNLVVAIEQSQSTLQEGSCEVIQAEEIEAAGEVKEPTYGELQNGGVTIATVLAEKDSNVCESEQSLQTEVDDGSGASDEKFGRASESDVQAINVYENSASNNRDFVKETVLSEEQSYAISQIESAKEQEEMSVVTEEVKSYVDSVVRMACFTHQEQTEMDTLKDLATPQLVEEGILEVKTQLESFVSPVEDITIDVDVSVTEKAVSEEVICPAESAVTKAEISAIEMDESAIPQEAEEGKSESEVQSESLVFAKEDVTGETLVREETILLIDSAVTEAVIPVVESGVTETVISPTETAVTEAVIIPTECEEVKAVLTTNESQATELMISSVEGSTTEAAIPSQKELPAVDENTAAVDEISNADSPEKTELAVEDSVQKMDASFDETLPLSSPPLESTPQRPDTLALPDYRGGKIKLQPVFANPKNQAGTPASLLSDDGSIYSVTTLDAVDMFPITPSPGSLSDDEDDLSDDPGSKKQESLETRSSPKRLVSVDSAMAEDIGGDWTGEKEILEAAAARQREKQKQLDSRQRSAPKLKDQGRQLSVASAAAKQRMEGVHIPEEWQDDEFSEQKLYGPEDTEDDFFYKRSVPKMDSIAEDEKHRLRVDSDLRARLRGDSDMSSETISPGTSFTSDGKQRLRVDSDLKRLRGDSSMSERSHESSKDRARMDSDVSDATLEKFASSLRRMSEDSLEDDMEYLQEEGELDISDDDDDDDADLGARPKKKIPADLNLDGKEVSESTNGATPAVLTPTSTEMSWDDDGGTGQPKEVIPEYSAKEEMEDKKNWRRVMIAGKEHAVDMRAINPYKKVLSHGGYYGDGLNAIIVFASCYMPDKSRKDYNYVMHNLFLYVVSTLELLVAQDYMIVYFHGAAPKSRIPSLSWMRKCYKMIDRKLRKNLKGLYLVHPTTWLKTVVRLTRPFVSSKFSSKLKFIYSLEELEKLVPMDFVYVPEEVRRHDERIKRKENASHWWGWLGYTNTLSDDDFEGDGSELSSIDDLDDLLFPQLPRERGKYGPGEFDFPSSPHSATSDERGLGPEMESEDSGCSDHEDIHIDGVEGGGFMEDDIFAYSSGNVTPVNRTPRPFFINSRRRQSRERNRTPTNE